jgi:DNA repair protein RadC
MSMLDSSSLQSEQALADSSASDRPRERMAERGAAALAAPELVALVLGSGIAGESASQLAARLLDAAGGLRGLGQRTVSELTRERGMGLARATRLAAAFEIGRRVAQGAAVRGVPIRGGGDVYRLLGPRLRDAKKENFVALLLDGRHRLLREERVSEGSLTSAIVHPREVFGPAIREGAAAVIVAHNHPSGDPSPSREDLAVTARLLEVAALVGIELVDHVVIGDPGYVSLRERGHLLARGEAGAANERRE